MISFTEYKKYYLNYIDRLLGIREQELDCMDISEEERLSFYNYSIGTKILLMVAFIEAVFLCKADLKELRNFNSLAGIDEGIHQIHLSCFIYIRDCIAHNPNIVLLNAGVNTEAFKNTVNEGKFNYAKIDGENIVIDQGSILYLHRIIRKLYGES